MTLDRAIEVFVRGFALNKSRTYPYVPRYIDGLWIMADAPTRKDSRMIEIITHGLSPAEAVARIKRHVPGWHFLCAIHPWPNSKDPEFLRARAEFKRLGYRSLRSETMFAHRLRDMPVFESDPPVRLLSSQAEADAIPQLSAHKIKLLDGARQFGVWNEKRDFGWAASIPVGRDAWVQGVFVRPDCRRRGYGSALMSHLLRSDVEHGVETSVLLASTAGARLYPRVGYEQIAMLQSFCPVSRD